MVKFYRRRSLDDESDEIRATGFTDIIDKLYDLLEVDKVYYISKAQLKTANKKFNALKHEYEMNFVADTVVQECFDDVGAIPATKYDFLSIDKLAHIEVGTIIGKFNSYIWYSIQTIALTLS